MYGVTEAGDSTLWCSVSGVYNLDKYTYRTNTLNTQYTTTPKENISTTGDFNKTFALIVSILWAMLNYVGSIHFSLTVC